MKKLIVGTMFSRHDLSDLDFGMGGRKPQVARRDPFGDKDKDGVMNVTDCQPNNPRKQGFLGEIVRKKLEERKGMVGRTAKAYGEYRAKAPEREEARIKALKRRAEIERQRTAIAKARRERMRTTAPTMDYGRFFGLGAGVTPMAAPKKRRKRIEERRSFRIR